MALGLGLGLGLSPVQRSSVSAGDYMSTSSATYMFGVTRLVSGFSGPLVRLRRTSDSAQQDFSAATGSDHLDAAAIATWTGGSNPLVVTLYDQLGTAAVATQATAGSQPLLDLADTSGAGPAIILHDNTNLQLANTIDHRNMSMVLGMRAMSMRSSNIICRISDGTTSTFYEAILSSQASSNSDCIKSAGNLGGSTVNIAGVYASSRPLAFGFTGSTTERRFFANQTNGAGAVNSNTGTPTTLVFGSNTGTAGMMRMWGAALYTALATGTMTSRVAEMSTIVGEAAQATFDRRVVFAGDSIMFGQNAATLKNTPYWVSKGVLTGIPELIDIGVPGSLLSSWDTNYSTAGNVNNGSAWYTAAYGAGKCLFVVQAGTNDINAGTTGAALYATATSLVAKAKASGYKVMIVTVVPRNSAGYADAERLAYNTLVRGNTANADIVIDPCADAVFDAQADADNTTYYSTDKIHLTDAGYQKTGPYYIDGINWLWAPVVESGLIPLALNFNTAGSSTYNGDNATAGHDLDTQSKAMCTSGTAAGANVLGIGGADTLHIDGLEGSPDHSGAGTHYKSIYARIFEPSGTNAVNTWSSEKTFNGVLQVNGNWLLSMGANGIQSAAYGSTNVADAITDQDSGIALLTGNGVNDWFLSPKFWYQGYTSVATISMENLDRFQRLSEVKYPERTTNWWWIMQQLTPIDATDARGLSAGYPMPTYMSGGTGGTLGTSVHLSNLGYDQVATRIFNPLMRAWSGGVPYIAEGRTIESDETTAQTAGGFVADITVQQALTGCSVRCDNTDFNVAIQGTNTLRYTRATSTVLKDDYSVVPVWLQRNGAGRLANTLVSIHNLTTVPGVNTLRGQFLDSNGPLTGLGVTKWSMGFYVKLDPSLSGRDVQMISAGGVLLSINTSGNIAIILRKTANLSSTFISASATGAGTWDFSTGHWIWIDVDGSLGTSSTIKVQIDDGAVHSGTGGNATDTMGVNSQLRIYGGTPSQTSTVNFMPSGPALAFTSASPTDTVFPADFCGPFLFDDYIGFTSATVSGATTKGLIRKALVRDISTKAPIAMRSDYAIPRLSDDALVIPYVAIAGYASDLLNGSADVTNGLRARNFGSGPDFILANFARMDGA